MKVKYFADDGTEFNCQDACKAYENKLEYEAYKKEFVLPPLKDRVKMVVANFKLTCSQSREDDWDLRERGKLDNRWNTSLCGSHGGMVFLRDDGVDVLLEYIKELEEKKGK